MKNKNSVKEIFEKCYKEILDTKMTDGKKEIFKGHIAKTDVYVIVGKLKSEIQQKIKKLEEEWKEEIKKNVDYSFDLETQIGKLNKKIKKLEKEIERHKKLHEDNLLYIHKQEKDIGRLKSGRDVLSQDIVDKNGEIKQLEKQLKEREVK